ncbi:MAG TPA: phosphate/phosphite/phosphonate ABC transporter substrate-binding protein [Nitrospirota bacterium]
MKRILLCLFVVIGFASISQVALAEEPPLKVGIAAMISPKETIKCYTNMLNYLSEKMGKKITIVQRDNYAEMDSMLEKNEVSVAFVCSGPYVKDHSKFGAELLVAPQVHGKAYYQAYIIANVNSTAQSIDDFKGKKFGFTDPKSNTGKLVPTFMVAKKFNMTPEAFFSKVEYTGSHDKSIEAVGKKAIDGASVDGLIYDYIAAKNPAFTKQTKIIDRSPLYGIPPIVVNKNIDPEVKKQLRDAFLNLHRDPKGKAILDSMMIEKFVVVKDSNYDTVRGMENFVAKQVQGQK